LLLNLLCFSEKHDHAVGEIVRLESHVGLLKKQVKGLKNIETELKDMRMKKEKAEKDLTLYKK
jgi:hypothetical protein